MQGSRYHRFDIDYNIIGYYIDYEIIVHIISMISNDIDYDMKYDIMGKCSIRSAAGPAAAAASLRRFLISADLILL